MRSEKEIRDQIKSTTNSYKHVFDCGPATVDINAPRALMQVEGRATLDALYWALCEKRPAFTCDDKTKLNH